MANAPAIKKLIVKLAGVPKKPVGAVAFVTVISAICCFINWGFGLIIGALLAKEVAKKIKGLDYRLIIAAAYSGFVIWHAGISGSIPLGMTALNADGVVDTKRLFCFLDVRKATSSTLLLNNSIYNLKKKFFWL